MFRKNILFFGTVAAFICCIFGLSAIPGVSFGAEEIPMVYVTNVNIEGGASYDAGEIINGTFTLYNHSTVDMPSVHYSVALIGGLKSNRSRLYGEMLKSAGTILKAEGKSEFPFSLKVPNGIAGKDFAVVIQAKAANGRNLGWLNSKFFNIKGKLSYLEVLEARTVTYDRKEAGSVEQTYPLAATPSIYKNKFPRNIAVQFTLANRAKTNQENALVPVLDIYSFSTKEVVYHAELKEAAIKIAAGQTAASARADIPNFNYQPGLYEGRVRFLDNKGQDEADIISFRYFIEQDTYKNAPLSGSGRDELDDTVRPYMALAIVIMLLSVTILAFALSVLNKKRKINKKYK